MDDPHKILGAKVTMYPNDTGEKVAARWKRRRKLFNSEKRKEHDKIRNRAGKKRKRYGLPFPFCQICGSEDDLILHHPNIDNNPNIVEVRCQKCETKMHKLESEMRKRLLRGKT